MSGWSWWQFCFSQFQVSKQALSLGAVEVSLASGTDRSPGKSKGSGGLHDSGERKKHCPF